MAIYFVKHSLNPKARVTKGSQDITRYCKSYISIFVRNAS